MGGKVRCKTETQIDKGQQSGIAGGVAAGIQNGGAVAIYLHSAFCPVAGEGAAIQIQSGLIVDVHAAAGDDGGAVCRAA